MLCEPVRAYFRIEMHSSKANIRNLRVDIHRDQEIASTERLNSSKWYKSFDLQTDESIKLNDIYVLLVLRQKPYIAYGLLVTVFYG